MPEDTWTDLEANLTRSTPHFELYRFFVNRIAKKLLKIVRKLKVQDGSRGCWKSFRAALKLLWEREDIKELEIRLQRTQMTMALHICALASHAQEDHASRLTQLQSENNKLQSDQSVKIDKIMVALDEFRRYIESVQKTHPESPTPKEIMSLEQYLFELSLSREKIEEELAI
ncbi:hypothetical protein N7528_001341 [Penicillium herquei]|nr:hypothetical protein N7528_001341 [Penicillium herquei]